MTIDNERAIRAVIGAAMEGYAAGFSDLPPSETDNEDCTITMEKHEAFVAIKQNLFRSMAVNIASLHDEAEQDTPCFLDEEGKDWKQGLFLPFPSEEELLISRDFWNRICKSDNGYNIVMDEFKKNAPLIMDALSKVKKAYIPITN
jgi:hypothetical protein